MWIAAFCTCLLVAQPPGSEGKVQIKRNYVREYNERMRSIPEDQRAWPLYIKAIRQRVKWDGPEDQGDPMGTPIEPGDPAWERAVQLCERNKRHFETIRAASKLAAMGFLWSDALDEAYATATGQNAGKPTADPTVVSVLVPYLGEQRRFTRALRMDARAALVAGESERWRDDVQAMLGLARQAGLDGLLIGQLVRIAIVALAIDEIEWAVQQRHAIGQPGTADLLAVRKALEQMEADGCFRVRLDLERIAFDDLVQRVFTDDGRGDGVLSPEGVETLRALVEGIADLQPDGRLADADKAVVAALRERGTGTRAEQTAKYQELMTISTDVIAKPLWDGSITRLDGVDEQIRHGRTKYLLPGIMFPAVMKSYVSQEQLTAKIAGIRATIAAECYRRAKGQWPAALADTVPEFLPAVPLDRHTGKPLLYRLVDGRPVIYSTGADLDDDGGRLAFEDNLPWPGGKWYAQPPAERADGDWILFGWREKKDK